MKLQHRPVLGLAGNAGTGKDFIASMFVERGYTHISSSDIVREEIRANNLIPSRSLQTNTANEIRRDRGGDYLVVEALRRAREISRDTPALISGLYSPAEGKYIQSIGGKLIYISVHDSRSSMRDTFQRVINRADGSRDTIDYEEFQSAYIRENSGTENQTNLKVLGAMADFVISNPEGMAIEGLSEQVNYVIGRSQGII